MSHLRLAHPAPAPKPKQKLSRHEGRVFSPEEQGRLRAALRNARAMFSTWSCLASAMRVRESLVHKAIGARGVVSAALAIRFARALGVPLESLLRAPTDAATCPHCGARRAS
jgi:hypothetical protein